MSTRHPADVLRVPGRLVINPTDLTGTLPYGGTELGVVGETSLLPAQQAYLIRAEEYGGVPVEAIQAGEAWALRSFDADALARVFSSAGSDAVAQQPYVASPGTAVGTKVSARAVKLAFCPEDYDRHPFLILYSALPLVEETARLRLSGAAGLEIPVVFHATYDASSRLIWWGNRHGATL